MTDATTPDPDRGEVLSIMGTLQAMTEIAQLTKEANDEN